MSNTDTIPCQPPPTPAEFRRSTMLALAVEYFAHVRREAAKPVLPPTSRGAL